MSVEPIGLFTILVGLVCLMAGPRATVATTLVATLLGSAAALLVGSATIQPAHLLVGFAAASVLSRRREAAAAARTLAFPRPGFWLACLLAYGIAGGYLLPRLLPGASAIVPVGTSSYAATTGTVPLGPVSGNFTQGVYLLADVVCFALVAAVASTREGFRAVAAAGVAYAAANVLFALLDLATYSSGTGFLLEPIRNAQYAFHLEEEASGLKRIAGSFTEASSFAHATLGAIGFTGTMWLCGRRPAATGPLFAASLVLLALSTSSTGLVGLPPMLAILYATAMGRCGTGRDGRRSAAAVLVAPVLLVVLVLAVLLDRHLTQTISDFLSGLVFNKASSQSGIERSSWNAAAWRNFLDTAGLGVGLGTARASSFVLALLSNEGLPGLLFYAAFAATCLGRSRGEPRTYEADVRLAARNACLGLLMADALSGTLVDQGLFFYALAALACAVPRVPARTPSHARPTPAARTEPRAEARPA